MAECTQCKKEIDAIEYDVFGGCCYICDEYRSGLDGDKYSEENSNDNREP